MIKLTDCAREPPRTKLVPFGREPAKVKLIANVENAKTANIFTEFQFKTDKKYLPGVRFQWLSS